MEESVFQYYPLAQYSGDMLIQLMEAHQKSSSRPEGMFEGALYQPGFWVYRLREDYNQEINVLDDKDKLKTVYSIYVLVHRAKKALSEYEKTRSATLPKNRRSLDVDADYGRVYHTLGNLCKLAVIDRLLTAYDYLVSKCRAPVRYEDGSATSMAVNISNWGIEPVKILVKADRLDELLASKNCATKLLQSTIGRDDILKYIILNDTRDRRGYSLTYKELLYNAAIKKPKCKTVIVSFALKYIPYPAEYLADVLLDISRQGGEDVVSKCVSSIVNAMYKASIEIALFVLESIILNDGSGSTFYLMIKHQELRRYKKQYLHFVKMAAKNSKYNKFVVMSFYVGKELLCYLNASTLLRIAAVAAKYDNTDLEASVTLLTSLLAAQ